MMLSQNGIERNALIWISDILERELPAIRHLFETHQTHYIQADQLLTHLPARGVLLAYEMDWNLLEQAKIFESQLVLVFYRDQKPEFEDRDNWLWIPVNSDILDLVRQIVLRWAEEAWIHRNNPDLYELMGHDIRAPLAELHVMLLTNGLQNERAIKERVEQLRAVIDDIYWLSNSNDAVANWNIHQTDLSETLVPFIQRIERFAENKPIELITSEIGQPGIVKGDEKMIGRIFKLIGDLIEDRVSYGLIEIKSRQTVDEEIITIHDMDQGWLQPDESAKGNTLFSITKKLTYIRKLALAMSIQLEIEETDEENVLSLAFQRTEKLIPADDEKLLSMNVLVIDDNPLDRSWLTHQLEQQVGKVFSAEDGWEAFNILEEEPVDLILLDLQMPVMDGFSFIEAMSDDRPELLSKIVAVTAYANKADHAKLAQYQLAGLLYKPVKQENLLHLLYQEAIDAKVVMPSDSSSRIDGFDDTINEQMLDHINQKSTNLMAELRWVISLDAETGPNSEDECNRLRELVLMLDYYEQKSIKTVIKAINEKCDASFKKWDERTLRQFAELQDYCWKLYKKITQIVR